MKHYIFKRLIFIVPMLLGISLIMFIVMHLAPGDPASIKYGLNPQVSESARREFNVMYGLDKPVMEQYFFWLKRFFCLDFGRSLIDGQPVMTKIFSRLPATILLQGTAFVIIFVVAIPLGIISAVKRDSWFDRTVTIFVFVGYAMPTFWLALLLVLVFGVKLQIFPVSGMSPWYTAYLGEFAKFKDLVRHMVLPVTATAFSSLAALSRYSRSSMIEALGGKYILTARAKGLCEKRIIFVHAFRNALLPIITLLGLTLPVLVSGSFIFETIFAWPGMGRLGYEAIMNYDYPVVMGVGVIATLLTLIGILISDILYAIVDPRIRVGSE
ncbi:MAG: ABC transporter permease [Candidatus Omnitrophota bacterium]